MREMYWFPYENEFIRHFCECDGDRECSRDGAMMTLKRSSTELELIDYRMYAYCGVERGRTKESIYRLLGWLANSAKMRSPSDVPHDASTGSAADTD